jgi:hypothetical protein
MPNYQDGKVYMIWAGDDRYYGSTVNTLSRRFTVHKSSYKTKTKPTNCHLLFDKYGVENCKIELVELFPCNSIDELHAREGYYIRVNNCLNKVIPLRTQEELKEYHKNRHSNYYNEHKEELLEKKNKYNNEHKDKRKEYRKAYYEKNKDEINRKKREKREKVENI